MCICFFSLVDFYKFAVIFNWVKQIIVCKITELLEYE